MELVENDDNAQYHIYTVTHTWGPAKIYDTVWYAANCCWSCFYAKLMQMGLN